MPERVCRVDVDEDNLPLTVLNVCLLDDDADDGDDVVGASVCKNEVYVIMTTRLRRCLSPSTCSCV